MSSNNNPDNIKEQPESGAAEEVTAGTSGNAAPVSRTKRAAKKKKRKEERLIFGFDDDNDDTVGDDDAENDEDTAGGLIFGGDFLTPEHDPDDDADDKPEVKKGNDRITFTIPDPEEEKAEAERKAREEAERKAREEAERKAREEAERKAREEAERKAREEAERKAREEAERKAREEAERKAREEAERKAREEAERKAREEAAEAASGGGLYFSDSFPVPKPVEEEEEKPKAKKGTDRIIFSMSDEDKARAEKKRKAREEEERRAKEEEKRRVEIEKKRKIEEEAERKAKEEAERKAKAEAERKAKEEVKRKAKEEAERKAKAEAERKAKEEVKRKAKEEAERKAKKEAERKAKEEAERKAKKEEERKAKEEAERKAKEKAERKAKAKEEAEPEKGADTAAVGSLAEALGLAGAAAVTVTKAAEKPEREPEKLPEKLPEKGGEAENEDAGSDEKELEAEIAASVKAMLAEKSEPVAQAKAAETLAKKAEKQEKAAKKKKKEKDGGTKPLKPMLGIANIVYTAVLFGGMAAAFIFLPRSGISESEQRMLAEFPQFSADMLAKGQYTNGITEYFNDNVPYREEIKKAAVQMRKLYGISYNNAEVIGPMVAVTEEPEEEPVTAETEPPAETALPEMSAAVTEEPDAAETDAPAQTEAPVETTAPVTTAATTVSVQHPNEIAEGVITNGQVVTKLEDGHWWGISLFGGGAGTKYADALNRFRKALGDDVNIYNMVVPTSGEYYLPDIYSTYNASHRKSIDSINEKLDGVIPVPAIDALAAHASEDIYLRTDHHWQPLGAYYAAKCFAETAGVPFADISTMEKVSVDGYMGTMWSFTKSANLGGDPEVFTYYKPSNSYTTYYYDTAYKFDYSLPFFVSMPTSSMYSTFMGGDKKIVRISTDAGTGRKLVVFKDSYGNAEIPFYFGSFDEIYVCDMRYFDLNAIDFIKFTGATDLLFTMCTFSAVGTNANGLDNVLSNPSTTITETAG